MQDDDSVELATWVELEGCFNFRDLGGYHARDGRRMQTGQVFRSDGLQHLTSGDLDRLTVEIGLAEVVDLRSGDEIEEDGRGAIAERARIHHVPLFPGTRSHARGEGGDYSMPGDMGELYFLLLSVASDPIVEVVRLLADSSGPIVFHCAAGKDRTGVISALLLSLLDISEETIVADYAFSRQNIDLINARLSESASYQRLMHELPDGAYDADPEAMRSFLARVRQAHGSIEKWARKAGIDESAQGRLRSRLLR